SLFGAFTSVAFIALALFPPCRVAMWRSLIVRLTWENMVKKRGMSLIRLPLRCSIEVTKERRDTEGVSREIGSEKNCVERNSRQVRSRECPGGEAHAGGHGPRDAGRLDG